MFDSFMAGFMTGTGIMNSILLHCAINSLLRNPIQIIVLGLACCFCFGFAGLWIYKTVKDLRSKGGETNV